MGCITTDGRNYPPAQPTASTRPPGTPYVSRKAIAAYDRLQLPVAVPYRQTRAAVCAKVLAEHGMPTEITRAMVEQADTAFGQANPGQTLSLLRHCSHAIRAYCAVMNIDPATGQPLAK